MPKDACYKKVKARYRVFPSAYASGAIAKCRKVGAANWGNKGKKKKAAEKIAVVVEEVHLSSEGFNAEEAKKRIAEFAKLAEAFSAGL